MIVIDADTPRWIRELARFIHIKSLLFLHGNILDLVSYPLARDGERRWVDGDDLSGFLRRFLTGSGYEIVGLFDPVDGLSFAEPGMEERFRQIQPTTGGRREGGGRSDTPSSRPRPGEPADPHAALVAMSHALCDSHRPSAFVFNLASRLLASPDHLSRPELALFTRLLKISQECKEVIRDEGRWHNALILVCDKLNDLPAFLYVDNPRTRSITLDRPERRERARFCRTMYPAFHAAAGTSPPSELVTRFSALTEGLSYYELNKLVGLSRREHIPLEPVEPLIERYKYGITHNEWDALDHRHLSMAEAHIAARIKGQAAATARVLDSIKRARLGLAAGSSARSQRPRAVLFFAGPTGVGKTELAKALAALLFGSEERLLRFDMSEYSAEHAAERLLGAPPGYLGYESGGQLTNRVKEHPFSVLLFDEIEKAHPRIFDKFLQLLDDGRMTSGQGETVYFSECIVIFTSNLGTVAMSEQPDGPRLELVSPEMPYSRVRETILKAIREHFNLVLGRPEILNRFGDNFVVFDFIRPPVDEEILDLLLDNLVKTLAMEREIDLAIGPDARRALIDLARNHLEHGGRGIRNLLDTALVDPLARWLFDHGIERRGALRLEHLVDHGPGAPYRFELTIVEASR